MTLGKGRGRLTEMITFYIYSMIRILYYHCTFVIIINYYYHY